MSQDDGGSGEKPAMPDILRDLGRRAVERLERRPATPKIEVRRNEGGWSFHSPYDETDQNEWEALLFDAFATRSIAAFHAFTTQLAELSPTVWNGEGQEWLPNEWDLVAAVQIVRSVRPRNEAEACLAAQMVAVHRMQMKLSAQALSHSWPEPRTCAIAGKLARTYAMQLETMTKLKGKGSRQRITVRKYSQHEHKHIHLHQGDTESGTQAHGPRRTRNAEIKEARETPRLPSLLSEDPSEDRLPKTGHPRKEKVSTSRRGQRIRSS
jgi:hypothetical protein